MADQSLEKDISSDSLATAGKKPPARIDDDSMRIVAGFDDSDLLKTIPTVLRWMVYDQAPDKFSREQYVGAVKLLMSEIFSRKLECSFDLDVECAQAFREIMDEIGYEVRDSMIKSAYAVDVYKADEEHIVAGVVLKPNITDLHKEIYDEKAVRDAAHYFMEEYGKSHGIKLMHRGQIIDDKVRVLESYVLPIEWTVKTSHLQSDGQSLTIPAGSWIMVARVLDQQLWDDIKQRKFTGWSIGGTARAVPVQ